MRTRTMFALAAGTAALATVGGGVASATAAAGCGAAPARTAAYATSPSTFDDATGDSGAAPDLCAANLVTNDNGGTIYFALHVVNRGGWTEGDVYAVFVDADQNPSTGGVGGTEYLVVVNGMNGAAMLGRWDGARYATVAAPTLRAEWLAGNGPMIHVNRSDLGGIDAFRFKLFALTGEDADAAPEGPDAWSYRLQPLQLTVGPLQVGAARAGRELVARMEVVRSDFDVPVDKGVIGCDARVGTRAIRGTGSFQDEQVVCRWRIPRNARGKRLTGSVAVTVDGVEGRRTFTRRVGR